METTFDRETAISKLADGRYSATMATSWWVVRGPNGGYLAAVILRALTDAVGDPERAPRSLTVHYASAPGEGEVELATVIERVGRSLTTCTCRMEQEGKLIALAVAAFSKPRPGPEFCDVVMPQVPGPEFYVPMREPPPRCARDRAAVRDPVGDRPPARAGDTHRCPGRRGRMDPAPGAAGGRRAPRRRDH